MAVDQTARKSAPENVPVFRAAPHNIEAEQALLGAILVNNEAFYRVSDFLEPAHFFEPIHQKIYELASSLIRAGKVASPVTLKTFLPPDLDVAGMTPSQYLARLAAEATTVINAEDYGRTIADLDRMLGGLQKSDLVVLAGRPGMGKTALATNLAYNIAKAWRGEVRPDGRMESVDGGIVGFFSCEMSAEQLATRIIAEQTEIPSYRIRRGEIDPSDFDKIAQMAREMEALPLYIDETGGLSISQLTARARRLKRQRGLDLLVIDYIQLLSGSSRRAQEGRVQEVTEITTGLKALAKELNVPILALSQLSRQVESRDDKRPQLSDLRESGSIEQDADVVLFIFREEYYLKNKEPRPGSEEHFKWLAEMEQVHGKAELIIGKQRHGPTGTVQLHFDANVTRFSDLADA